MKHTLLLAATLCGLVLVPSARAQDLYVGSNTANITLELTNGTNAYVNTYIGYDVSGSNNTLGVFNADTNLGTLLTNSGEIFVGNSGSGNSLVISNGGTVAAGADLVISAQAGASNNSVSISGGSLTVTNGRIDIGRAGSGALNVTGGTVTVANLIATNGTNSVINFTGGTIISAGTTVGSGSDFSINGSGAAFIADGGTHNFAGDMLVGDVAGNNGLVISNGGTLASARGYIGNVPASSNNSVLVTGANSLWTNSGVLYVGFFGSSNSMVISNGGTVAAGADLVISAQAGASNNSVSIISGGSLTVTNGRIDIGRAGSGTLNVTNGLVTVRELLATNGANSVINFNGGTLVAHGATISNGQGFFIGDTGGYATYLADGGTHSVVGSLMIGNTAANNRLAVIGGGTMFSSVGILGDRASSSNNLVRVTGPGSTWANLGALIVGGFGSGNSLMIDGGGAVSSGVGSIGNSGLGSSNNTVLVTDSGSTWVNNGHLSVGLIGSGNSLVISNGGTVANTFGYVGNNEAGSSNTVLVTGPGSVWNNSTNLYVGFANSGNSLTIAAGATVSNATGYIGYTGWRSSNNTVLVTGPGSTWVNSGDLWVGRDPGNSLTIADGGKVSSVTGFIGELLGDNTTITVTGTGSTWTNSGDLRLGYSSKGSSLTITNGGKMFSATAYIGNIGSSQSNTITVAGSDSTWVNSGDIYLGLEGSGNSLVISNGGSVGSFTGFIGNETLSTNHVAMVTGPGSVWNNGGNLIVGNKGSGNQLVVSNGGTVSNHFAVLGLAASSSNNVVVVTDPGSVWNNNRDLTIGYSGSSNTLVITNGGAVLARDVYVGRDPSWAEGNQINVTGGSLIATNSGFGTLDIRRGTLTFNGGTIAVNQLLATNGTNSLIAFNGGTLVAHGATISNGNVTNGQGFFIGDTGGNATYVADGGTHSVVGLLRIGNTAANNRLVVTNGGAVSTTFATIGYSVSSPNNSVLVTGPGSTWANSSSLQVGFASSGNSLVITNGGQVSSAGGVIAGLGAISNNTVLVTGPGSTWANSDSLIIGGGIASSGNSLTIADGGLVSNTAAHIGYVQHSSNNTVLVTGPGSLWNNSGDLHVGYASSGNSLTIAAGATVSNATSRIGLVTGGYSNTITVAGSDSTWVNSGDLWLGGGSGNSLTIADGGKVFNASGRIGEALGDNTTITVTGTGSTWNNSGDLYLGKGSKGNSLTITNGGKMFSATAYISYYGQARSNTITVAGSDSTWVSSGDIYLSYELGLSVEGTLGHQINVAGGSLVATNSGAGTLDIRYGTLSLNGGSITVNQLAATNGASSVIAFNAGLLQTASTTISNGAPFIVGNGTDAAELRLQGGTHSFADGLTIQNSATLSGSGIIGGDTFIAGTHNAGNSPGLQTFLGNLTYSNASVFLWELAQNTAGQRGIAFDGVDVGGLLAVEAGATSTLVFNAAGSAVDWSDVFWATNQSWLVFSNSTNPTLGSSNVFAISSISQDSGGLDLSTQRPGSAFAWDTVGNDIYLNYTVPEPSTYALLLMAGAGTLWWARRRR